MATRRRYRLLALAAAAGIGFGCGTAGVSAPVIPPSGIVFTLQSAPLDTNFEATPVGTRRGKAVVRHLENPFFVRLPLLTWADTSVAEAMANGDIETAYYADYQLLSVLGIYVQLTVEVWGD